MTPAMRRASIRTRLLVALLAVALIGAVGLSAYFLHELESFALRKLEERLHTQATITAALVSETLAADDARLGANDAAALQRALSRAAPYAASRMRVLDARGVVLADSGGTPGASYASRAEIRDALDGGYGAATRMTERGRVALYVAVPITVGDEVVGVSYASSTTFSIMSLLSDYRLRLAAVVLAFVAATFGLAELLARWLSRPLTELAGAASRFAGGDHAARAAPRGSVETQALAEAFNAMADEVERAIAELREEERRKSRFVSDVSHELRTPLTAIRGAAETLLDGDVSEEDQRQFLASIVREADRLTRLANDLLTLQRIEGATGELPLGRVDLRSVAQRAIEALQPLWETRGVSVVLTGSSPVVLGDADRLQQVVANLLDNATRVTPEGGSVEIRISEGPEAVTLEVLDEGPGIPPDALPHIFERFFRAQVSRDRSTGGAGLGLAIVAAIVRAHAGTVEAVNRPEGGSVFVVRLPALKREAARA
ncbi:MAG: ATP-binding protein [Coriobacteriia bacterium]|nr:ATP-binding protein [Coriobacteriia bacterium]